VSRSTTAIPESKLARYISGIIDASEKRQSEIAADIGISPVNQNFISMVKTGKTKLPLAKVPLLAKSLGIDPLNLLRRAIEEYMPEFHSLLFVEYKMPILSRAELEFVEQIRASKVENPRLKTAAEKKAFQAFLNTLSSDE
jgi:transcriptional regulator with XRE-family HTH domain